MYIYKDDKDVNERIRSNVHVLNSINDETFGGFIISRSDFEKLTSLDSWEEDTKSVIVTASYYTRNNKEVFASPYINVKLNKEEDLDLLSSYAEKYKLKIVMNLPLMPLWYILNITPDSEKSQLQIANELYESGDFAASGPDLCSKNLTCSNDPLFNQQWGLHNSHHPNIDISVSSAWNYATGKNIKIAIIDYGVAQNNDDLIPNIDSLCYDTRTLSSQRTVYDYGFHGTHCAGIAAAKKDNTIQIAGVAPDAKIVSISNNLDDISPNNSARLANGITWAYNNNVDVISCSWHAETNSVLDNAIQDAFINGRYGKGCVVVFAAGNDSLNSISYPANCNEKILVVGAIDSTGMRATYSNYGTELDLVAPGDSILSTLPYNTTGKKSGTSMACPHVAGVAALILERNSELTVDQVNSIICSNAKKLSGVNFNVTKPDGSWNDQYGYGLVDAYNSVTHTPNTVYIQNDTIFGTRIVSAGSIYIGRNVTDTKPYGNVILGQGDIKLKARYVEIKNSTTVPLGTTLIIENN